MTSNKNEKNRKVEKKEARKWQDISAGFQFQVDCIFSFFLGFLETFSLLCAFFLAHLISSAKNANF